MKGSIEAKGGSFFMTIPEQLNKSEKEFLKETEGLLSEDNME